MQTCKRSEHTGDCNIGRRIKKDSHFRGKIRRKKGMEKGRERRKGWTKTAQENSLAGTRGSIKKWEKKKGQ